MACKKTLAGHFDFVETTDLWDSHESNSYLAQNDKNIRSIKLISSIYEKIPRKELLGIGFAKKVSSPIPIGYKAEFHRPYDVQVDRIETARCRCFSVK
jgi:hypothetical protein